MMIANDNVYSLGQRKQLSIEEIAEAAAKVETKKQAQVELEVVDAVEAHKDANLQTLRDARRLVENDQLESLVVIGRQRDGEHFFTDFAPDFKLLTPAKLYALVGVLHTIADELKDLARLGPELMGDGSLLDATVIGTEIS